MSLRDHDWLLQLFLSIEYAFPWHSLFPLAFLSNESITPDQKGIKENSIDSICNTTNQKIRPFREIVMQG